MRSILSWGAAILLAGCAESTLLAQTAGTETPTALTIYNQDFALVRTPLTLDLKAGTTEVLATNVTARVEPDSVVLRDPLGKREIRILEQDYDGALRVQAQMLAKFEGQTIDFMLPGTNGEQKIVAGKIVRAGSVPQFDLIDRYGQNYFYQMNQPNMQEEPLIEIEGKLRYGLPGIPLFPASANGLTLKPTLRWVISSDRAVNMQAELDYITRGLRWDATYNVVAPAEDSAASEKLEMIGWVDVTNESGTDFKDASVKLMAGDISKLVNQNGGFLSVGLWPERS